MRPFAVSPTWSDKDSKVERFRQLYEAFDFLDAYAAHTDLRVEDDPHGAIGRVDEWESHGTLQCMFLIGQGLEPESRLLDLGCGTGRLARKVVPYLHAGHYTGADISAAALAHAKQLSVDEGWSVHAPRFVLTDGTLDALHDHFDLVWAHSVFTHLPEEAIDALVADLAGVLAQHGRLVFTYKRGQFVERTGLKQFRFPFSFFETTAQRYGLVAIPLNAVWPASQRTGVITRPP